MNRDQKEMQQRTMWLSEEYPSRGRIKFRFGWEGRHCEQRKRQAVEEVREVQGLDHVKPLDLVLIKNVRSSSRFWGKRMT